MSVLTMPPTARDFEIYEAIVTRSESTRQVAREHDLSQTRVRQIATQVSDWLEEHLPARNEAAREKEVRMLQHVTAARLEHQYGELMEDWREKGDPRFLRQATRIALAQARLGVMPGRIESLAADAIEGPLTSGDVSGAGEAAADPPAGDCSPAPEKSPAARPAAVSSAAASTAGERSYPRTGNAVSLPWNRREANERALLSGPLVAEEGEPRKAAVMPGAAAG